MSGPCLCGDPACGRCFPGAQDREYELREIPGYERILSQYRRAGLSNATAQLRLMLALNEAAARGQLERNVTYVGPQETFNDIVTDVLACLVSTPESSS